VQPLVSIIIPTYNRAHLLGETLDSILAQTYRNWECIVVDDGSADRTDELMGFYCERDARIQYNHRPKNRPKGANACRNYGFEISKGEYINWFDSDDIMHPQKLEFQITVLMNSNSVLCVCQTEVFEDNIKNVQGLRHPYLISDNFWEDYLMFKILWLTQSPLWNKRFLKSLDYLFDEELQAAQEWEFHIRALNLIDNYKTLDKPLVYLRNHQHNISNDNREEVLWNYFLARLKVFNYFNKQLSKKSLHFLLTYFLNTYKNALINSQMNLAGRIWFHYISKSKHISFISKIRLTIAYLSFKLTKRGNLFISYLN